MTDRHFASMQSIPSIPKEWFYSTVPLRQNSRAIGRFAIVAEFALTIAKNPKFAKLFQQLVVAQQIFRIFRMTVIFLIDQIGFKDDVTATLQRSLDVRN